jgi:quercetin dioxygenase-like cupin family protein
MKSVRCLIVLAALFTAVAPVDAQDPVKVNPNTVRLKLENDRVRVLEARLAPGDKEQLHSHPPYVIYVISGGRARNHSADGKTTETVMTTGDVVYRDALTHWAENIGTTEIHLILVELKTPQTSTASHPSE